MVVGQVARVRFAWVGLAWLGSLGLVVLGSNARPQPRLSHCTTEATDRHADSHLPPLRPCCCLHPHAAWFVLSMLLQPLLHPQWANSQQSLRLGTLVTLGLGTLAVGTLGLSETATCTASLVWGTVVDSREQRSGTQTLEQRWTLREDRTLGLQRAHRTRPRLFLVVVARGRWGTVVVGL